MQNTSILHELKVECPFPEIFEDRVSQNGIFEYRRKIGHIRADYDDYRWWNTIWPLHKELSTPEISKEIDEVYKRLTSKDAFATLSEMTDFCHDHPQSAVDRTEYNFYYEGEYCLFWIRCITRNKDYNLYIHAFTK